MNKKIYILFGMILSIACTSIAMDGGADYDNDSPQYLDPMPSNEHQQDQISAPWTKKQKIAVGGVLLGVAAVAVGIKLYKVHQQNSEEVAQLNLIIKQLKGPFCKVLERVDQFGLGNCTADDLFAAIHDYANVQGFPDFALNQTLYYGSAYLSFLKYVYSNKDRFIKLAAYDDDKQIVCWIGLLEMLCWLLKVECANMLKKEEHVYRALLTIHYKNNPRATGLLQLSEFAR